MAFTPARNDAEFRALMDNESDEVSIIRTRDQWLESLPKPGTDEALQHPLHSLSADEIAEFTDSLVFRKKGLAGARVGDLGDKLTYNDFRRLWGMFGLNDRMVVPIDGGETNYSGYYCQSHGTCAPNAGYICTSNC